MPSAVQPERPLTLPQWNRPEKTKEELPWADIKIIDLSKFDQPGGKKKQSSPRSYETLYVMKVHETGFFSLINTGFSPEEVQRQYDIGKNYFSLPVEDKGQS
ncbi:hypothetical protein ACHAQH_002651 [Verticillium albo-atrum]